MVVPYATHEFNSMLISLLSLEFPFGLINPERATAVKLHSEGSGAGAGPVWSLSYSSSDSWLELTSSLLSDCGVARSHQL